MSNTIKDISVQQTVINSTDWFEIQEDAGTSKKIQYSAMTASFPTLYIGESIQYLMSYKAISTTFPWLCLSLADATLDTTHYSQAFIDVMRARKVIYDETNTAVSAFTGSWSSSNFTLDNNAANLAMIAELYEDWVYAGSPSTGWRILVSGGSEYDITGFTVASRIITVSGSPSGTSIEIYLNRIKGSTTSCKHFSEAGLASYQAGVGKINGLRRRDKFQGHYHNAEYYNATAGGAARLAGITNQNTVTSNVLGIKEPKTDGTNDTPRTGSETQAKSSTDYKYLYVGSYS